VIGTKLHLFYVINIILGAHAKRGLMYYTYIFEISIELHR